MVRIFPNTASCLRLVRALAVEIYEGWLEATRYLNMEHLRERKKEVLRAARPAPQPCRLLLTLTNTTRACRDGNDHPVATVTLLRSLGDALSVMTVNRQSASPRLSKCE